MTISMYHSLPVSDACQHHNCALRLLQECFCYVKSCTTEKNKKLFNVVWFLGVLKVDELVDLQ